ncbi:cytochrome b/b6 domain-containing protein [Microbacterium sp. YY-03]|uniref:cytochrome b/b6 domain-containing protein n=1 Tax=Microbacterium sp. YY-03 TaxID=3421636 RepID=UPI003D171694
MATYSRSIRRGLPRVAGGAPWPAGGDAPVGVEVPVAEAETPVAAVAEPVAAAATEAPTAAVVAEAPVAEAVSAPAAAAPVAAAPVAAAAGGATLRRGLPRVAGGDPWPPAGSAPAGAVPAAAAPVAEAVAPAAEVPAAAAAPVVAAPATSAPAAAVIQGEAVALRRGLPRVAGGEGWPPAGSVARPLVVAPEAEGTAPATLATEAPEPAAGAPAAAEVPAAAVVSAKGYDVSTPLPFKQTVFPGKYANVPVVKRDARRYGKFTFWQWAGIVVLAGGALLGAAAMAVITVRLLLSLPFMQDFMTAFPGEYDLPEGSQPGFPVWAQWQHYFNMFLMLLIIRSGWTVRTDRRPSAFWTPKRSTDGKGKISLTLWLHQSLDLLWVINGIVFVVLLFVSGHWVRIVPTSWEVFPNALSAILQYVSLDWPTEHGWVNYNSIQQLMYFTVVFIAAPVAIITGVRMSNLWPKNAAKLNKLYPVEVARALHLPTMLFFVLFIIIHVFLVFATGALRNLNHMFGGTDEISWTGFWLFFAGLCVMVGAWFAARPLVIAPIAKLFGKVSAR